MATASAKNYYDILGVSKDATQEEIRTKYRKLARKYHPDKTGGDKAAEEKLKEINAAYDTLKNPERRKEYDQMMFSPFGEGGSFRGYGGAGAEGFRGYEGFGGASFEDLFGDIFGQGGPQATPRPQAGADIEAPITITLREAAQGVKKTVSVPRAVRCSTCSGSGAAPGSTPARCPLCQGTGRAGANGGAQFFFTQTCPRCRGTGQIVTTPCATCNGTGQTREARTVTVTIPAGAKTGTRLRLAGQGDAGDAGAPPGDLYIVVRVAQDDLFQRRGNDLVCEVPITLREAVLGGTIRVPTLTGQADLIVPPGTQNGAMLRMRGLGLTAMKGGRTGDLLVRIAVETPKWLSSEAKKHFEAFADAVPESAYPRRRAFEAKLRRR